MKRAVSVGIAAAAVLIGAVVVEGAEGIGPTTMDEGALLDATAFRMAGSPIAGSSKDLFLAAVASGREAGAGTQRAQSVGAPLEADTIHYRVCKDLSICFVAVPPPPIGIVPPLALPPVVTMTLTPVPEVPVAPPVVHTRHVPWALAAIPLIGGGLALLDHDHDKVPAPVVEQPGGGAEQPRGGGEQPGGRERPGPKGGTPETPGTVTPEPWSVLLFGTGLAGVLVVYRRRERSGAPALGERRPGEPAA